MKRLIFLMVLLSSYLCFGQNLKNDLRRKWYTDMGDLAHVPDSFTLNLYPMDPAKLPPHYRVWAYRRGHFVRDDIETRKGIWDPYDVIEQWSAVKSGEEKHLIVRIIRFPGSKKRTKAIFKLMPTYDNGKLVKVFLVRIKGEYE